MTSQITYTGNLRTIATHVKSGNTVITDAPTDNNGKGETFSPTDLVATALGSCMLTIMGIVANRKGLDIEGTKVDIKKVMASNPRRISAVEVTLTLPNDNFSTAERTLLEKAAKNCPVALSLSKDLIQEVAFVYPATVA